MAQKRPAILAIVATLTAGAVAPDLDAQEARMTVGVQPAPAAKFVPAPVSLYPYPLLPARPQDGRTAKQRCWDEETGRLGSVVSDLDRRAIDLKCSRR
jgi:hypothetical protein